VRRAGVRQGNRLGPVDEVGRRGGHDVALPVLEVPPVGAVLLAHRVPKGEVLGIEGPLGDHRPVGQGLPAEPVRRAERQKPLRRTRADDRLVPGVRRAVGVGVLEHGDMPGVGLDRAVLARGQHDVVLLRPLELEQAHVRLFPVNPVGALRVAGVERVRLCQFVVFDGQLPRFVVHAVPVAVPEDRMVAAAAPLPGGVVLQHDFPRRRVVQHAPGIVEPFDQIIVHEQLTPRPDVDRLGRADRAGEHEHAYARLHPGKQSHGGSSRQNVIQAERVESTDSSRHTPCAVRANCVPAGADT